MPGFTRHSLTCFADQSRGAPSNSHREAIWQHGVIDGVHRKTYGREKGIRFWLTKPADLANADASLYPPWALEMHGMVCTSADEPQPQLAPPQQHQQSTIDPCTLAVQLDGPMQMLRQPREAASRSDTATGEDLKEKPAVF